MDDDPLLTEESDEEFRKMENDIDQFLSSIRENVSKTDLQSEATCSKDVNDYDSISSDDLENHSSYNSVHSVNNEQGLSSQPRKFNHNSSSNKKKQGWKQKKQGWRQKKWKGRGGVQKQWRSNSQEEQHGIRGRQFRQRELSRSGDEYDQYRGQSSNKRYSHHPQDSFSPREEDEYRWSLSPRGRDEIDQERSPRRNVYRHERSTLSRGRDEYFEGASLSPQERGNRQEERKGRYGHKRRRFSPEGIEEHEHSQDSVIFDENFTHCRTSGSRSSEMESIYHKIYAEESDSPGCWSEDEENYDYGDQHTNPHWIHDDDDPFMGNDDDYSSSAGAINKASLVTACLERIVAANPEIVEKFSNACMSLLNKSVGTTCDSDYEYEESSCGSFADLSGRVSARSWRNSRSPSFSKGSFSGTSGSRSHRDRHEGSSRRIVVEYSQSPSPERGHSSRYDQKRPTAVASQTLSTKRRSSINHHKSGSEEDPKTSVIHSIKKIRKQCEEESNSIVRRALLALLKVHQRECDMYLKKPEAHPDYNKEYRVFLDKKSRSIMDLGGNPNDYNFQEDWKKYWPTQLARLFRQSWDTKMHKCTSMLLKKGHLSRSLSTSSRKEVTSQPHDKKQKISKHASERVNAEKSERRSEEVQNQEQQELEASSAAQCKAKKEEMDTELLSILKLLNHIKHKFKDCEASFDSFYQKALSFKQKNLDLSGILPGNVPLLEKIDTNLKETLEDEDLTLIQKAIIKETHERFKCFLKKSKENNSHVMKNCDDRNQVAEDLHPSVVTSLHTKKVIPAASCCTRTLTEVSIQKPKSQQALPTMTQEKHSDMTQPPPPGVTPPPSVVTPPPPGVTPPLGATPPLSGVTPPLHSVSPPSPGVTPVSVTVKTSPSGVISTPLYTVTSTPSVAALSFSIECAKSPQHITPAPSCNTSVPLHITPPPPGVTPPPPNISSSPPATLAHQSSSFAPSLASLPASQSLLVSNLPKSHDLASKVTQHPSTTSTSIVQSSKLLNDKDSIPISQTQPIHLPSKEFLRSTIKDCFLSASSPATERSFSTSIEEESLTLDSKVEESATSSVPTLPEDILKMFVVKPEDKSETIADNKSSDKLDTSVNEIKPAAKKRIKITIPQSSEKKRMPALNPILDDQELL